jgi:hypothetical protein
MSRPLSIEGVGQSANEAKTCFVAPVALPNGDRGTFSAPMVRDSDLPALWGLASMSSIGALIDTRNRRLFLPGPGGYKIVLSPGSVTHNLEQTMTGHLLLPCTDWRKAKASQSSELTLLSV